MANNSMTNIRMGEEERIIMDINSSFSSGNKVPYLISHPGVGKTTLVKKVNPNYLICNVSSFDINDLIGTDTEKPIWYSELLLLAGKCKDGKCLLIFDDFDRINPNIQKYVFGLTEEERKISSFVIPKNVDVLLCGDSEEYSDSDFIMDFKLNSRLKKIEMKPNISEWLYWANKNKIHKTIKAFLNEYPSELVKDVKDKSGKFDLNKSLTPKSWAQRISTELYIAEALGLQIKLDNYMDEKSIVKFMNYYKKYSDYRINDIINGKVVDVNRFTYTDNELSFIVNALIASVYSSSELENALIFLKSIGHSEYKELFISLWVSINRNKEELLRIKDVIVSISKRGVNIGR